MAIEARHHVILFTVFLVALATSWIVFADGVDLGGTSPEAAAPATMESASDPTTAPGSDWVTTPGRPGPARKPRRLYERKKHPTTLDPLRFATTRESRVKLELPQERDAFCFVVFGDRTGGPAEGIRVLEQAVKDTNLIEPDLVMTVGDLVQGYNQTGPWMAQMREYKSVMANLACPWFPVAGNHDVYWRGPDRPEGEHEASYEANFGPLWYAFEHKDCWFIAIYSDEGNPETGEKNFGKADCQRMSPAQYVFLKDSLEKAKDARHVFLFLHHPRWLGGRYGDDWNRVHDLLVEAGNVSIVFAGHIHRMRYDGPKDDIEYVTLATVGGAQSGVAPKAGYLHQIHLVTVRNDAIALSCVPVGESMDVRAITGRVSTDAAALAGLRPVFESLPAITAEGRADRPLNWTITNPVDRPVEVSFRIRSDDARWRANPPEFHAVLKPGRSESFRAGLERAGLVPDSGFRDAELVMNLEYLGDCIRVPIPEAKVEIPLRLAFPAPDVASRERALRVDGNDCLAVPSSLLDLHDGGFTLECWFNADRYGDRTGLITKTESSDYGLFVNKGVPTFSVFLGDAYANVKTDAPVLKTGVWHHLAGVYDGKEVRLYLDGKKVGATKRSGSRRTNPWPLLVGADVTKGGGATSHFRGLIDGVRITERARYQGDFTPDRRPDADKDTVLLLNMDGLVGTFMHDASAASAHARLRGNPKLVIVED